MNHAKMIGDGDRLDAFTQASVDDGGIIFGFSGEDRLSAVPAMVGKGIDLKGAAIEARAIWLLQCFGKRL